MMLLTSKTASDSSLLRIIKKTGIEYFKSGNVLKNEKMSSIFSGIVENLFHVKPEILKSEISTGLREIAF